MSVIREGHSDKTGAPDVTSPSPSKSEFLGRLQQTNLLLWLSNNGPRDVEELKAVRYALYHRCSRADFKVTDKQDVDDFTFSGRQSSVHIVSNRARRYLLWRLRLLAREQGWVRWGRSRANQPSRVTIL
jgi:hypothetical protein